MTLTISRHRILFFFILLLFFVFISILVFASYYFQSFCLLLVSVSLAFFVIAPVFKKSANYLLFFGSIIFTMGMGELAISAFFTTAKPISYSPNNYSTNSTHEEIFGSIPSKGLHYRGKRFGDRVIYEVVYTIGEDGFRVTPSASRSASSARINFFGGSFTFGEGLNDDETLPYYFAQLSGKHDVKNYGMYGWGVNNALALIANKKIVGSVNILITAPWHAFRAVCLQYWTASFPSYKLRKNGKVELTGKCRDGKKQSAVSVLLDKVLSHSSIYSMILDRFGEPVITKEMLSLYFALIEGIKIESARNGQKLVIGYIKARNDKFENGVTNSDVFQRLSSIADGAIDITLATEPYMLDKKYFLDDLDKHPSGLANSERAKLLNAVVEDFAL